MEFTEKVEYDPFDYGNKGIWPDWKLLGHYNDLQWEKEAAPNERVATFLGRQIAHAEFEIRYRTQWEPNRVLEAAPQLPVEQSA